LLQLPNFSTLHKHNRCFCSLVLKLFCWCVGLAIVFMFWGELCGVLGKVACPI
jgi:hypothetical protein